jgi:hypothetical protein
VTKGHTQKKAVVVFTVWVITPNVAETSIPVYSLPAGQGIESKDVDHFPQ